MSDETRSPGDEFGKVFNCDTAVFTLFGTVVGASAVFDLVAIAHPQNRPHWSDLMQSLGRTQRVLMSAKWAELPLAVAALITDLGLTLTSGELATALDEAIHNTQRYGAGVAFARLAAYLSKLAC